MYLFLKEKHSSASDFLSIFFLLNSKILFIKNYNAMLAKGAILKFTLVEYYRFTHLAQPKTF